MRVRFADDDVTSSDEYFMQLGGQEVKYVFGFLWYIHATQQSHRNNAYYLVYCGFFLFWLVLMCEHTLLGRFTNKKPKLLFFSSSFHTGNPLICDCDLLWYKQWLQQRVATHDAAREIALNTHCWTKKPQHEFNLNKVSGNHKKYEYFHRIFWKAFICKLVFILISVLCFFAKNRAYT